MGQFLAWCVARGLALEAVSPPHVGPTSGRTQDQYLRSKQHLVGNRMLGAGSSPAKSLTPAETRSLLDQIDTAHRSGACARIRPIATMWSVSEALRGPVPLCLEREEQRWRRHSRRPATSGAGSPARSRVESDRRPGPTRCGWVQQRAPSGTLRNRRSQDCGSRLPPRRAADVYARVTVHSGPGGAGSPMEEVV